MSLCILSLSYYSNVSSLLLLTVIATLTEIAESLGENKEFILASYPVNHKIESVRIICFPRFAKTACNPPIKSEIV